MGRRDREVLRKLTYRISSSGYCELLQSIAATTSKLSDGTRIGGREIRQWRRYPVRFVVTFVIALTETSEGLNRIFSELIVCDRIAPENSSSLQVLTKVLSYLPPSDRLNSALTCTKWAQVVAAPELLEDILLSLRGPRLEAIETLVIENDRHYKNVRFSKGTMTRSRDLVGIDSPLPPLIFLCSSS